MTQALTDHSEDHDINTNVCVLTAEEIHRLAAKMKKAVGAEEGDKANCHSDYVDDDMAKTLQAVELVELDSP